MRRTHPLGLAAHGTSWGWSLGFGDWKFWGNLVVPGSILGGDYYVIWRGRDRFQVQEERFGGREVLIWRGREQERGEAHGIGGGGSYACVGLGADVLSSGATIQSGE